MYIDVSSLCTEVLRSTMAQKAIELGLEPSVVERTILEKISKTGAGYSSLEELLEDGFNNTPQSDAANAENQGAEPGSQHKQILLLTT